MDVFCTITSLVSDVLGSLFYLFYFLLDFNFILMTAILKSIAVLTQHLIVFLKLLLSAILTALEDFGAFAIDLFHGLSLLVQAIEDFCQSVQFFFTSIGMGILCFVNKVSFILTSIINYALLVGNSTAHLVFLTLALILRSIVMILQMFPLAILVLVSSIKNILLLFYNSTIDFFGNAASFAAGFVVASAKFAKDTVLNIPIDTYWGIVILVVSYFLFVAYKRGMVKLPSTLVNTGRLFKTKFLMLFQSTMCLFKRSALNTSAEDDGLGEYLGETSFKEMEM